MITPKYQHDVYCSAFKVLVPAPHLCPVCDAEPQLPHELIAREALTGSFRHECPLFHGKSWHL